MRREVKGGGVASLWFFVLIIDYYYLGEALAVGIIRMPLSGCCYGFLPWSRMGRLNWREVWA
jgi:hypothetical protein